MIEGIPTIPTRLADEISRYTEIRAASLLGWHPAKREMLILTGMVKIGVRLAVRDKNGLDVVAHPVRCKGLDWGMNKGEASCMAGRGSDRTDGGNVFWEKLLQWNLRGVRINC